MKTDLTNLNTTQAAEWLCLSKSQMAKMRVYGTGPKFTKLGKKVVYRVNDLNEWQLSKRVSSTSESIQFASPIGGQHGVQ